MQPDSGTRLKVVIQQQLLPPYRLPFFTELGKQVDLTVALAENVEIPGATTIPRSFKSDSFTIKWFRQRNFLGRAYQDGLLEHMHRARPDVLVAGSGYLIYYFWHLHALMSIRRLGIKLYTWGCDGYQFHQQEEWNHHISNTFLRRVHHLYLGIQYRSRVDGLIAYSEHTAKFWKYAFNVPSGKIAVVENALDTSAMEIEFENVRQGKTTRDFDQLIFVGRLIQSKRADMLVRAFAKARPKVNRAKLLIVGDGPERRFLESLVTSLGLRESVRLAGNISDKTSLARLLASSSCLVLPGYGGLAINEAMAAGLAIICSRGDGTERHLVRNGENGFIIPWENEEALTNAIVMMLDDPKRTMQMGEQSFRLVTQEYSLKNMVSKYVLACNGGASGMQNVWARK